MMTVYGRKITQNDMDAIAIHMNDEIREQVHFQLAPCTPDEFLAAYLEKDPDFEDLLKSEFGWKEDDDMAAYIVIEESRDAVGDIQNKDYASKEDAIKAANRLWNHLTDSEKGQTTVCVLESVNQDPDAPDHMDGNVIWQDGNEPDDNQESTDNERVISEWEEVGGVLGYDTDRNGKTSLYIMDDGEFSDRCKEFTEDEDAVAKLLCESALRNAGISEEKIDQLMNWE